MEPGAAPDLMQRVEDQAYYRCLNQDEDPPLPQASASLAGVSAPVAIVPRSTLKGEGPTEIKPESVEAKVIETPTMNRPKPEGTAATAAGTRNPLPAKSGGAVYRGSRLPPWTAEWAEWCAKYFPRSWDPVTGTVVHGSTTTGERVLCK